MQRKTKKTISLFLSLVALLNTFTAQCAASASEVQPDINHTEYNGYEIYYSDDYFRHSSTDFDSHLATLSMIMTDNTVPRLAAGKKPNAEWYVNQPNLLNGFFDEIGFDSFETNEDYKKETSFDTIGLAAAKKEIDDFTLIAVTVRSGSYFSEWANNIWLGDGTKSDYMHEGWYVAANKLITFLDDYATSNEVTGKVKVWVAGFSRGGATSNIAAGLLDNKIDQGETIFSNGATLDHDDLFAYTFEAPQGANYNSETIQKPGSALYDNIWNMVNPNDLVTKVAMDQFGFTRFGTDKYITTEFYDAANFKSNRETFKYYLEKNGHKYNDFNGDKLTMYNIPTTQMISALYNPIGVAIDREDYFLKIDENKARYDANIVCDIVLEELVNYIGSRENYCKYYQEDMKGLMLSLMNDRVTDMTATVEDILGTTITSAVLFALGQDTIAEKMLEIIEPDDNARKAAESLSKLSGAVAHVYTQRPNELISLAMQVKNIFQNHEFYVNISHMQAQDSYYTDNNSRSIVPLRDNADYGRMSFKNFNDLSLNIIKDDGSTEQVAKLDGYVALNSDIEQCNTGYALGYYVFLNGQEGAEIFMPTEQEYFINFKNFSMKLGYDTKFEAIYKCVGSNEHFGSSYIRGGYWKNNVNQNTDFMQRRVNMKYVY